MKKIGSANVGDACGEILDDEGLANVLGVEPRTLREWRNRRGLPHVKISARVIRYRRRDVLAWLDRQRVVLSPML